VIVSGIVISHISRILISKILISDIEEFFSRLKCVRNCSWEISQNGNNKEEEILVVSPPPHIIVLYSNEKYGKCVSTKFLLNSKKI